MESLINEKVKELAEDVTMLISQMTTLDNLIELLKDSDGYEELRSMVDKVKRDFAGTVVGTDTLEYWQDNGNYGILN